MEEAHPTLGPRWPLVAVEHGLGRSLLRVQGVRREIEGIHEISARSKADLEHVAAHRAEMVTLRDKLDGLLATIADT